ncbi:hypothetical protein NQZ68_001586 [Xyrichtys novacula]|uniref:Uncharacterized protein n=1 Tax=Xyrichtys novacula TaxID=13765 RepID=A0AAV1GGS6_XYRNO|nr:hypothetical protein NQZ68_001586 [Xyrichtys novacula]
MAVRTCNPFHWETNAAAVLSSPKRPESRAASPPAWSQYLNHRGGTQGSGICVHTVICSKHDRMNKNEGFHKIELIKAGGATADPAAEMRLLVHRSTASTHLAKEQSGHYQPYLIPTQPRLTDTRGQTVAGLSRSALPGGL